VTRHDDRDGVGAVGLGHGTDCTWSADLPRLVPVTQRLTMRYSLQNPPGRALKLGTRWRQRNGKAPQAAREVAIQLLLKLFDRRSRAGRNGHFQTVPDAPDLLTQPIRAGELEHCQLCLGHTS